MKKFYNLNLKYKKEENTFKINLNYINNKANNIEFDDIDSNDIDSNDIEHDDIEQSEVVLNNNELLNEVVDDNCVIKISNTK